MFDWPGLKEAMHLRRAKVNHYLSLNTLKPAP
jgi:hypothetical protein